MRSDEITLQAAQQLVVKVMAKSLDTTALSAEKSKLCAQLKTCVALILPVPLFAVEFATVTRSADGQVIYHVMEDTEIDKVIADTEIPVDPES